VTFLHRELARRSQAAGFDWFDLVPTFRARAAAGEKLIYDRDEHWTERGHVAAAAALLEAGLFAAP
jgi:hypothetical protein